MSDASLRARSTTEIVDAAFTLYRRDFLQYIMVGAIAYSPMIVISLLTRGITGTGQHARWQQRRGHRRVRHHRAGSNEQRAE